MEVAKRVQSKAGLGRNIKSNVTLMGPGIIEKYHAMEGTLSQLVEERRPTDGPGKLGYLRKAWPFRIFHRR